ncbi:MAG: transcriptional regulator [Candidatus Hydrogenedentota bacterium]|nr:MAG: transcriptional regulator [Candidatus Hydrogenedentota bacterium]
MKYADKISMADLMDEQGEYCGRLVQIFSILGNKIRFKILCLLHDGEKCVTELVEAIENAKEPNVSQQLKLMTSAGILSKRRDGRMRYYSLADNDVAEFISFLKQYHASRKQG